ncbi:SMP-30/gluconolactonase/LRE family protein [Chelativorans xinjiangense]|uniref:SMP-30/gluconolactonase/LRE family protein n=1 Tax=Chelativorans xinjiangense TaxID=2681485 RepID=UPI0013575115|nr:SMP-30/gluconolactonase/LRE family protein [Chelativorans xinjiangense]
MTKVLNPDVECVGEAKAVLGESACWSAEDETLLWVDILGRKVLRTDIGSGRTDEWAFPEQTGFVQPADDGTWLVGQENGILRLDPATGAREDFLPLETDNPATRTNDAGCDRQGRLLVGTMHLPEISFEPVGTLYRIAGRGAAETLDTGLYVPNGIAFSPDGGTVYWADTYRTRRQVWCARYDPGGEVGEKRPFVQLDEELGRPDGAAVDAAGCYWVAAAAGWQLLRYTPSGELDLIVRLPVQRPSKLAFGGADLTTIFITTISEGLGEDAPRTQPLAGRLLAVDVGIQGLPPVRFRA